MRWEEKFQRGELFGGDGPVHYLGFPDGLTGV